MTENSIHDIEEKYYADNEDAYAMRKELKEKPPKNVPLVSFLSLFTHFVPSFSVKLIIVIYFCKLLNNFFVRKPTRFKL